MSPAALLIFELGMMALEAISRNPNMTKEEAQAVLKSVAERGDRAAALWDASAGPHFLGPGPD